ncbi:MAG: VOC family protein [Oligoflexales bacterium]|nr:VOC family protein [Oligoflexales bacterium]
MSYPQKLKTPSDFCWVELMTSHHKGVKNFYGSFLNWTFHEEELPDQRLFTMISSKDAPIGGLFDISEELRNLKLSPRWLSYVRIQNLDQSLAAVQALGGEIVRGPLSIPNAGRMAWVEDPVHSLFALWEAQDSYGSLLDQRAVYAPGWRELITAEEDLASPFYETVFGWEARQTSIEWDGTKIPYTCFFLEDRPIAGLMKPSKEMTSSHPLWLVHFNVPDCNKTVEICKKNGGTLVSPVTYFPKRGQIATLRDPYGAVFAVSAYSSEITEP